MGKNTIITDILSLLYGLHLSVFIYLIIDSFIKYFVVGIAFFSFSASKAQSCYKQCISLIENNKLDECQKIIDTITHGAADSILYLKTYIKIKQENLKEAQSLSKQLASLNPEYYENWYLKGLIAALKNNHGLAIENFNKVIEKNPKHLKALYNRALSKGMLEDYRQAIFDLDRCIDISPDYANAYYSRGYWYEAMENYLQAITNYQQTIKIDPQYKEAYLSLAYVLNLNGDKQKACDAIELAIEKGIAAAIDMKSNFCK